MTLTIKARPGKVGWYVFGDDYMVTFGPVPQYTELKRYPFRPMAAPVSRQCTRPAKGDIWLFPLRKVHDIPSIFCLPRGTVQAPELLTVVISIS